jgi:oligopeptide transport system substrate-binding protein
MKMPLLASLIAILILHPAAGAEAFRFHLFAEPHTLDPQTSASASGNYLVHNIYRGLYRLDAFKGLVLEGAKSCRRKSRTLRCELLPRKWSTGEAVTAMDYVRAFRRLADPDNKSPQSELLRTLKNWREVWSGKLAPEKLGVSAPAERVLLIEFAHDDPEFEYKLSVSALSPYPPKGYPPREEAASLSVNGPYKIAEWKKGSWVRLVPNPEYKDGNPKRPAVEALFIEEDSTALRLYEAGKLTFLRRLTASEIPRFRSSPGFHQFPMARFDYVGFGSELAALPEVRSALVRGVEFKDFLRLFDTRSQPGCPSLPARLLERVECQEFKPVKISAGKKFEFQFSKMGGDDIARAAEWFQGQWKKHAGVEVELQGQEQAVYLSGLRVKPPAIFRKGVSLDRPTCLAAVELFEKDHPENYIRLNDPEFEKLVQKLRKSKTESERKKACTAAVAKLLKSERLIPLGEMHFTVLASTKFKGWGLNELNQLDLSHLAGP